MIAGTDPVYGAVMTNYVIAWSLMTQVLGPGLAKPFMMKGAAGAWVPPWCRWLPLPVIG